MYGTHTVAEVGKWTLAVTKNVIDVPKFGTYQEKLACRVSWEGTIEGSWYMDDLLGQKLMADNLASGTVATIKLYVDANDYYSGSVYISSMNVDVSDTDRVPVTINFAGSGALTLTQA